MIRARHLLFVAAATSCAPQRQAATTGPTQQPEPAAAAPTLTPGQQKLERARKLRSEAEAITPPAMPGPFTSHEAALDFLKKPVMSWIRQRRPAVERAEAAYGEAAPELTDEEMAVASLEVGEMWLTFADLTRKLTLAGAPPEIVKNPAMLQAYEGTILAAVAPQLQTARASFERCISQENASPAAKQHAARCRELMASLPGPIAGGPPVPTPTKATPGSAPRSDVKIERAWVATTQARPCVFAGTLALWRESLALTPGGPDVALFEHLEVDALELPTSPKAPIKLTTRWPVQGVFYLELRALPLELRKRVDLASPHIWLSVGAAISAATRDGQAMIHRPLAPGQRKSHPEFFKLVPCSDLQLPSPPAPDQTQPPKNTLTFKGTVRLHSAPMKPALGALEMKEPFVVTLLDQQPGWYRIAANDSNQRGFGQQMPYDFDAWTAAKPSDETAFGLGIFNPTAPGTHVTTAPIELHVEPNDGKPIGKLVTGVPLLVGETRAGWVNIAAPGIDSPLAAGWGFWIPEATFKRDVRAK